MKATKFFFVALLSLMLFSACQKEEKNSDVTTPEKTPVVNTNNPEQPAATSVTFDETTFAFGKVPKDIPVKHRFSFSNTGTVDLLLESVKPACGCTTSDYTKEPIKPGEKGFVEAEFNAKAVGIFKKTVTVTANTDPRNVVLAFEGEVEE